MQSWFRIGFKHVITTFLSLLIISGCATPQSSITAPQTPESQHLAALEGLKAVIKVYQGDNPETEVKPGESINLQVGDRIEVDKDGLGILKIFDFVEIELFQNAIVLLSDLQLESGGSTFVRLEQVQGHTQVSLTSGSPVRLTLETEDATITTLEKGTVFLVCKAPGVLTCLDVQEGGVQNTAQGVTEYVKAGEASYVLKDQPPSPAICAPVEIFNAWEEQARKSAPAQDVGALVKGLPQQSCSASTAETGSLPGSAGMVEISEGTYEVGTNLENDFYSAPQDIPLDNFWIDAHEVTNAQYQKYLDATGDQPPNVWPDRENYPVRGVTWDQANAYCTWAKKRLPTEAEWEVAGRGKGPNARLYPWGSDPDAGGKFSELPLDEPYDVGTYAFNVSPFGVYDLVGNVWEWVGEPYTEIQEGLRILRGGRFGLIRDLAYRYSTTPNDERSVPNAGFRCAANEVE